MTDKDPTLLQYGIAAGAGLIVGGAIAALVMRRSTSQQATGSPQAPATGSGSTVLASGTQPVNDFDQGFWSQWLAHAAEAYPAPFAADNWQQLNEQQKTSSVYGAFSQNGWARNGTAPVASPLDAEATTRFDRIRSQITITPTNDTYMVASLQIVRAIDGHVLSLA